MPRFDYDFPPLNPAQDRVVELLNDVWQDRRSWPTFDYVTSALGLDSQGAAELLRSFPVVGSGDPLSMSYGDLGFDRVYPAPPDDSKVRLTVRGLARDSRGEGTAVAFVTVLAVAARKLQRTPADPDGVTTVEVTAEDVLAEVPASFGEDFRGLGELLSTEPFGGRIAVSFAQDRSWRLVAGRAVARYLEMRVDDYLRSIEGDLEAVSAQSGNTANLNSMAGPAANKVFISHAGADRELGRLLKETLQLGGVPSHRIFYSSARDTGVRTGEDLRSRLQRELADAAIVIEVLTPTFFTRPMCLMELGGAWALGKPTYPIVVPPTTLQNAQSVLGEIIMGQLTSDSLIEDTLSELRDQVSELLDISLPSSGWTESVRSLKARLPQALANIRANQSASASSDHPSSASASSDPVVLSDVRWVSTAGSRTKVMGRATNTASTAIEIVSLRAVFLKDDVVVDTADGFAQQLAPGQVKTFTIDTFNQVDPFDHVLVEIQQWV